MNGNGVKKRTKDIFMFGLAGLITLGYFSLVGIVLFVPIPKGSGLYVGMLFGGLQSAFISVISYFYGSSSGSAEKTAIMANGGKPPTP
jgi:hypothetical protein